MTVVKQQYDNIIQELQKRVKKLEGEIRILKEMRRPGLPMYDFLDAPVGFEGQVAILDNVPAGQPGIGALPRNNALLHFTGAATLGTMVSHTIKNVDVSIGDGIFVVATAPSKPSVGAPVGVCTQITDSKGNSYSLIGTKKFEANPPVANQGSVLKFFYAPCTIPLTHDSDYIQGLWDNQVYDRAVYAFALKHDGGAHQPILLASTADNDAAVYASNQVGLQSPAWTPQYDNAFMLGLNFFTRPGGPGSWSGIGGYTGYQMESRYNWGGSQAEYYIFILTQGADVYLVTGSGGTYELDLGKMPANVPLAPFYGDGQVYGNGANSWKGITIWGIR